jgi:hypothetical protein
MNTQLGVVTVRSLGIETLYPALVGSTFCGDYSTQQLPEPWEPSLSTHSDRLARSLPASAKKEEAVSAPSFVSVTVARRHPQGRAAGSTRPGSG